MARLLIPTRNRPTSLASVLRYLAQFHATTDVIVADGSDEFFRDLNRQNIEALKGRLTIEHRPYPADLPFFERLLDVVRGESAEFLVLGSDDDYPMMDTLMEGEAFLRRHPEFSTAMGILVNLRFDSPTEMQARLSLARPIIGQEPLARARQYAAWPFSTTYAVTRRDLLIERYERARKLFLVGFYDFSVGIHDCMRGKIHALPDIGFICTRNYNHSYLRAEDGLVFLRRSREVLEIVDQFRSDLIRYAGLDGDAAKAESERLIKSRVAELAGRPPHKMHGFRDAQIFTNVTVQKQFEIFEALFEENTPVRIRYREKLAFILAAIKESARSEDNKGEKGKYETLEAQLGKAHVEPVLSKEQ